MLDLLKTTKGKKLHLFNFVLCSLSNWQHSFGHSTKNLLARFFLSIHLSLGLDFFSLDSYQHHYTFIAKTI